MTVKVFAWPPVGVVGAEWSEDAPVQVSRSLITGAERISAAQRKRRVASLRVSALARNAMGAGYIEMLKRHLAGIHLVRLYSYPINWHIAAISDAPGRVVAGRDTQQWAGLDQQWYAGATLAGTTGTEDGWPVITVSGFPPGAMVARPGEFLTAFEGDTPHRMQITKPATSDASGAAVIRLFEALPSLTDVQVAMGSSDTGAFRPVSYPRSMQPTGADWTYDWEFREVFEDEVGTFDEVDPWR